MVVSLTHGQSKCIYTDMKDALQQACAEMMSSCACEGLRRATRTLTARYQEALSGTGVRATQLPILVAAYQAGPVPLTALAEALVMERTTLTRNLRGLERAGFLTIEEGADARVRLVVITDTGVKALEKAIVAWQHAQDGVKSTFGASRVRDLVGEVAALTEAARS